MSSDRFKELKEVDEESKSGKGEEEETQDVTSTTGSTGSTDTTSSDSTTDTTGSSSSTSSTSTDGTTGSKSPTGTEGTTSSSGTSGGNVKDRNPRVAMFPPEKHKQGYDDALRKVKAICSLADEPEPNKLSEFSGAVLKQGYQDIEGLCLELGLEEAYREYGEVVES